ncbi:MAG: TonB-dependent receptor domain-containing protein [Flammeovirgaceae bacterium]
MGNNVNEQGFSFEDYFNFSGASNQMGGGGGGRVSLQINGDNNSIPLNTGGRQNGIVTNYAGGVNYNKDLNKKTQLTSNYFFSRLDQDVVRETDRVNFLPQNLSYNFNQDSRQRSLSDTHRGNFSLDHKLDSANSIKWTTAASYGTTQQNIISQSQTYDFNNQLQNQNSRSTFSQGTAANINTSLLLRHRFKKKGRTFSSNLGLVYGDTKSNGDLNSLNEFFTGQPEQRLLQTNNQSNVNSTYSATLSYTEPLGNRKYLEVNYALRTNQNDVIRSVFDVPTQTQNDALSNSFQSNYLFQRPGFNFRVNRQKYNLAMGATYQVTRLDGATSQVSNGLLQRLPVNRTFENLLPSVRFNYDFISNKHLRFEYETSMLEPTIQQLQPVINNNDPLNISVGNPNLKPAYVHTATANYTGFDPARMTNLFALVTGTYMKNAVTSAQVVDPSTLIRSTRPENTDYSFTFTSNINIGFRLKELNSRINIGPTARLDQSINLLNNLSNKITQRTIGGTIRYNYTLKEILIIDLRANLSNQQTDYENGAQQGQNFFNKTYGAEVSVRFLKNYHFNPDFEYLVYDSRSTNFSQSIPLLSLYVSRSVLKNNAGEIKFGVSNLLDQNVSIVQTANSNFFQREVNNNLGRYFMLSFTYLLNRQMNPMGGGGGRRAMRMIINN